MDTVPDQRIAGRSRAHRAKAAADDDGLPVRLLHRGLDRRRKRQAGARPHTCSVTTSQIHDFTAFRDIRGHRLVQENRLAKIRKTFEIIQMIGRIVDFHHNGVAIRNRLVEIKRDLHAPAFQLGLAVVQSFLALERRLKTQAGHRLQTGDLHVRFACRIVHEFRHRHAMACIKSDDRNFHV